MSQVSWSTVPADPSATVGTQSVTKVPSAASGGPDLRLHAIVRLTTKGATVDMTVDIAIARRGRDLAVTAFISDTGAFPAGEAARIVAIVDDRLTLPHGPSGDSSS